MKVKEQVKIRERKLKNGNVSLFLETYIEGVRKYEWLKMYLIPEIDTLAKQRNETTRRAAETIKARRIIELTNAKAGITDMRMAGKIRFSELVEAYFKKKERRGQTLNAPLSFYKSFKKSGLNVNTRLANIDKEFCQRFIDYLKNESELKPTTQRTYLVCLNAILNDAERNGLIFKNPIKQIDAEDKIKAEQPYREHLTMEEIKRLIDTPPIKKKHLKQVFLFACFCGLRISDLNGLKWGDIYTGQDGRKYARITQKKTQKPLVLPLCVEALKWLPDKPSYATEQTKVFPPLNAGNLDRTLKMWTERAGIKKHVSIHTARHTFATLLLTYGTDLYTVSKLLGHHKILTTQIYAQIVDAKKAEAVEALDFAFK